MLKKFLKYFSIFTGVSFVATIIFGITCCKLLGSERRYTSYDVPRKD